jgi:hypothetical protein
MLIIWIDIGMGRVLKNLKRLQPKIGINNLWQLSFASYYFCILSGYNGIIITGNIILFFQQCYFILILISSSSSHSNNKEET